MLILKIKCIKNYMENKKNMFGQINRGTELGEIIYNIVRQEDVINIVEIGTWNGLGSTKCIRDSIIENNKTQYNVISLETNKIMYQSAINNNQPLINFKIINGTIISVNDFIKFDEIEDMFFNEYGRDIQINWYNEDINNCKNSLNVFKIIPENIDLLILDGGEYSTLAEYNKLKDRYRYLILDDTKCLKNKKIREEIINNQSHIVINDNLNDRNGFIVCRKI